ncbi:MAG: sigma-54-dependent Fis family transcriptional regulator [Candidatus Accumulibacter sp.]|uniref:sigma-54-dependent transcriptional regulator n=1 Tax=Candidatus Accumulibacter TaxID=327159 RepID=UPI001AC1AD6A|nr:sigma-54 dependent transcriptional regulator [Accumulibacter sp.]MBK8113672.1 sigma-54-dependent Fis family transcriptional regulator [Accumulibacter sp.]MBK8385454.1 sigma-54-dependent Fis family transcriptional regulator [Accumulibacter sp.]MBK8580121.1 sigma-54-dependent Fis family transcriptional regulator [Candidatus Accumulibacter propinquus]MBN8437659.1 sigma-54-dependent Fis family transcriptional regulator [Accumulibacter sp.]
MLAGKAERRPRGELARVLVVDDEADIRELLDLTVARMGLSADCAASVAEARHLLEQQRYQLCITDMRLPDGDGLEIVRLITERYGETPVAVITAFGSAQNAVAALKAGAFDYLAKPVALEQLRSLIKSALSLPRRNGGADGGQVGGAAAQLIGESAAIGHVREMIDKLARSQAPVYISGESGTGKELAARLIHDHSARRAAPFVPVNCGAIPENLMESEFFGYRKGAFTGADRDREGFFQAATGGTLFLDEVADLPLVMQVKLLRAIQEKKVRKVGHTAEEAVDVRIISATHRMLKECVDSGTFRQDLYYRLNVIELRMPPLRERDEDVAPLVEALLVRICGPQPPRLDPQAMTVLKAYSFPGNVRELENILERATALCNHDRIVLDDLQLAPATVVNDSAGRDGETLDDYLNRVEKQAILDALAKTAFNRTAAARLLGVTFRSLRYRIERLGIEE